jgi:tetratricopeptide (TPR) repeat protein
MSRPPRDASEDNGYPSPLSPTPNVTCSLPALGTGDGETKAVLPVSGAAAEPAAAAQPLPPTPAVAEQLSGGATVPGTPAPEGGAGPPPERVAIPGYVVLGELGRGGMGVVYRARHRQLDRLVALKMIRRAGQPGERERRRFRTEAEAVARIDHPGIVRIYEIGEHQGLPFLALELCPGGSLEKKLQGTPLPPEEAARLLEALARAMHAAHQQRVIHRDLKPANVLLAADGSPKVADFGLAKKLDDVGQTQSGVVMGSPSYMSPEQAEGRSDKLGPATDIYALGAILYECLTGRPPFKAPSLNETILQVLRAEPAAPRRVNPLVPRDLETVCLKALQKERHKRYATALDMAEDLRCFLDGRPIKARPVGPAGVVLRWARRSPVAAGLTAAVGLLLLLLGTGAVVSWVQIAVAHQAERRAKEDALAKAADNARLAENEQQARLRAEEAERQAHTEAAKAEKVSDVLVGMFEAADPLGLNGYSFFTPAYVGEKVTARQILDRGAERVEREFKDQPAVQAKLLDTLGNVYRSLGEFSQAERLLTRSLEIRHGLKDDLDEAASLHDLGWLYHDLGDYDRAETLYRRALELRLKVLGPRHLLVALSKFNLAWLLSMTGGYVEAEALWRDVIALRRDLGAGERDVALALFGLAALLVEKGEAGGALQPSLEALNLFTRQEGAGGLAGAVGQFQQAMSVREAGLPGVAEGMFRKCLATARAQLPSNHYTLALILHELGVALERQGKDAEAEKCYRDCLDVARASVGFEHPKVIVAVDSLAGLLRRTGRRAEAEQLFEELLDAYRRRYGKEHRLVADVLAAYADGVGDDVRNEKMRREADALYRKGNPSRCREFAPNLNAWGVVLQRLGRPAEAERRYREALAAEQKRWGARAAVVALVHNNLASALLDQGKHDGVEALLMEALLIDGVPGGDRSDQVDTLYCLGRLYREAGDPEKAAARFQEALGLARKEYAKAPRRVAFYAEQLGDVLAGPEQAGEAAKCYDEALTLAEKASSPSTAEVARLLARAALARLAAGDAAGYRAACTRLLKEFGGTSDSVTAGRVARAVVLAPDATADWDRVVGLARKAVPAKGTDAEALRVLAAALYRAGKYEEAAARLRDAATGGRRTAPEGLLLALVQARQGDGAAARQTLAEACAALDGTAEKPLRDAAGASRWWQRQAEVRLLRREASSLMVPGSN